MGIFRDSKCQHGRIRDYCSKCDRGDTPTQGSMKNGKLVSKTAKKQNKRPRGWG